ncbi:A-kinase anchor protein 9 isoform X4 [Carassius gibelio]|uniref:A-kinase anchor protein 9 isoform X4 n=1 Tax=Carassius gibelio TaxID=101364 RepID=UPI002279814E|nr:A-kinase anchor protein 9 isoform X4 [Carassius gibelio]
MMEDEERQKKLQAGKAKLAEYRQRKAQSDGQKKQKKKKKKTLESDAEELRADSVSHEQTDTIEPESEVSTTAEDCSSEVNGFHERTESGLTSSVIGEEDLQRSEVRVEPDLQSSHPQSRIQIMEDELASKNMAMEELSRDLEEIRAVFGADGVQQLQDFEEALKQRDEIITQLTSNLQQARTEKEEVIREFLELTEKSQKLQIQFQQLQAGEILRSSNISSTAADLLQARQQITLYQQQLDERDAQVRGHQEKTQEQLLLIAQLQESLSEAERVRTQTEESFSQSLREKDLLNTEHQRLITQLNNQLLSSKQQVEEVNKHLSAKTQELDACEKELSASRQKERMSSGEILQLMKSVEELQQRCQSERLEDDWRRRMETLRDELDEMYGQQIVEMKRELRTQHTTELERVQAQHCSETEKMVQQHQSELERCKAQLFQSAGDANVLNVKLVELQQKLQETLVLREKAEQELAQTRTDKLSQAQELERLRDELQRAEIQSPEEIQHAVSDLRVQLDLAHKANGELEAKHESEITNYKIKLEMLEREKDAVLDRMAESLESELDHLRTQLLFSHEEELSRLRDDLTRENQLNAENLRDEMDTRHREALDQLRSVESERAALASERLTLLQDIARLSSANEQMCARLNELQDEIEKQRNIFSFAEKNFEVNYQELKDEYTCLVNAKLQLEQRLIREAMQYETKLRDLQTRREEVDGKTPESEKKSSAERLSLIETDTKRLEHELKRTLIGKHSSELMEKLEVSEDEKKSSAERLWLMEAELEMLKRDGDCSVAGGLCSAETHHTHIRSLSEELDALQNEEQPQPQEERERETPASSPASTHTHTPTHTAAAAAHEDQLASPDRLPQQVETRDTPADGDVVRASLMKQPQEMDGSEHDECRLQLEAQRISLSQIHAAQLQMLRESLSAQTQTQDTHEQQQGATELKAEFEECSVRLEERQRQEIELLKSYYQQQMEEMQERFTAEILLLQSRLQELTGAGQVFSMPSVCPLQTRDERCDRLQEEDEERVSVDLEQDLQAERRASSKRETLRDTSPPEETHLRRLEEEIAKVIVQMSVEFAQQTEEARISRQSRETSICTQTDTSEDEEDRLMKRDLEKEREDETERCRDELRLPRMQSCGTQTQQLQTRAEDETKVRGQGRAVTSQPHAQDPELSSDDIITERDVLRQALLDVLKTTAAAEETIGRHVSYGPAGAEREMDDGLEVSLKFKEAELQLQEAELLLEREEFVMSISDRLQSAVEKMLITITETSTQLEHAQVTQTELMREKFRQNEEMEELQRRQNELQERLCEEERAREQLTLELHRAEGVIDGYTGERLALEQQIRERSELQLRLEQELMMTASRLRELEQERVQIQDERELMSRQHHAMREGAGPRELHLLEETEKLMAEKVEVQRQAQKESGELLQQVKQLEVELEEQVSRLQELQETHSTETTDLRQQIQALEKQLENNRKFMDEQAVDREHERDVFQQEIHNLEQQLKNPNKTPTGSDRRDREVQELSAALQEKADWCSELLLSSEQLQRDVCERDEEIETLGARLRELEHTLIHRVEEVQHVSMASRADVTLEAQLQTEREALDRKEKEIVNLEEQLEQFREELENKSEEVNQLHMQLEIQRKEISVHQQDLQDQARLAQVLEEKDRQIAVLNEQLAKRQHTGTDPKTEAVEEKDELLREMEAQVECLRSEQERLKRNSEEEVEQLNAVIEKLQQELTHIELKQRQDESDEMKQRMDEVTTELDTLKNRNQRLEEALQEKTAACVVLQAQVQALEESAGSKVTSLSRRVEEKDSELSACRLKVEQAQTDADALYAKVAQLEEKLREKVAAVLVSQAQLEAVQMQTKELRAEEAMGPSTQLQSEGPSTQLQSEGPSTQLQSEGPTTQLQSEGPSTQLQSEGLTAQAASVGKTSLLVEKLKELEEGLSGMQKDQELQKQLLSSSEDEVMEYERRLALMIDLLNQMRTKPTHHKLAEGSAEGGQSLSELLEEVKGQAASTKEELNCYRELSHKLQEEIEMKESRISQLQADDETAAGHGTHHTREEHTADTAELLQELQEVKGQVSSTQQELESCRAQSVTLQELLQEREMSIALLKDQLHRASQEGDQSPAELLQELQEVKGEAAATKEQLNSVQERSLKLQEDIEVRDASIAELKHRLQELQTALAKSSEQLLQSTQPEKKGDDREHHGMDGGTRADVCVQTDPSGEEELEEMMLGYEEKIAQMQELHAAEILDMESRHICESESLKTESQRLRDELRTLQGPAVRSERALFRDGYSSDSGSDWTRRVGQDVPPLQECRSSPEGAHRDVEPDVLPDRVKSLLREVHQEGMQVLSLTEADRPPQSRETDALINTIQSLQLLTGTLQTETQVDEDWRAELLCAVQQVFVQERDVLKSLSHSPLERLDMADAVLHQDTRHRELMETLYTADRSSLRSEIQQLRAQLTQRHHQDTAGLERESAAAVTCASDRLEEVKTELNQTKLELESALNTQHTHLEELHALRAEVSLKTSEVHTLTDTLALEQKRAREMQWAFEKEKHKTDRKQESDREEVEELKLVLEEQRGRVEELSRSLETEVSVSSELQVQLEAQRARSVELSSTLEKQKELNAQLLQRFQTSSTSETHDTLEQTEDTCSQVEAGVLSVESLLQTLQTQLAEKQTQVEQMIKEMERQKLEAVQCKRQWDEEKSSLTRVAAQDQNALQAAHNSLSSLERRASELRVELDAERESVRRLETDRDRLQETVRQLEDNQSVRSDARPQDQTRDCVLQTGDALSSDPKHRDNILSRLQLIVSKINSLTSETPSRLSGEAPDRDSLAWLHSNVQDVLSLLQHIPSAPSALPESAALLAGGSFSLNERLLRQNAELTGFVSRLTEEKNDLRNQLLKLEEELRRYRAKKTSVESVSSRAVAERQELMLFSSERESWAQDRNRLEKSLRQAEAELTRLRGEIRSDALRDLTGADLDNTALRRMYGKYLRSESFRKALIYQKKYLLLLLGGFQECEEATLSLIARMSSFPEHGLESVGLQRRGLTRFRSAVRVSIALSRMRFLVKRWQRAAGGTTLSRNGISQITGADVRNESSYLHPGGADVFRERRASSRGRTGRDSPRSAALLQHRFHTMAGDAGGLPCSHLQNYDPDRALTDYISRLEALQRRLGSVTTGSSSYAQMHFGVRR